MIGLMSDGEPIENASEQQMTTWVPDTKAYFALKPWLLVAVLMIVTVVAYLPVLRAGFIWDDDDHLTANPAVAASNGLQMIWSSLAVSRYYPLTLTTFWFERHLWGLNPMPYHLVNVLLHAANGVLVFLLLRRLRVPAAWWAALLWVLHPVNVESAAWITELKNTQSGIFFFGAVLFFLKFEEGNKSFWFATPFWHGVTYALAFSCGLAAILTKASTVVLPLALLLCVWWKRGRLGWRDVKCIGPFLALSWFMSALAIVEQRGQVEHKGTAEWSLGIGERLIVASKAVWFYAAKLLWPVNLVFVYPRWEITANSIGSWLPLAGLVVATITLWVCRRQSWARAGLFGFGFFASALLPALGFFDVYYFRFSFVADHFQYLASLGVVALAANGILYAFRRCGTRLAPVGNIICAALAVTLAGLTWEQTYIYRNVEVLWRDTVARNPQAWMAHYNLGKTLSDQGRVDEATTQYEQALRIKPDYAEAHSNLGSALAQQGKLTEAVEHWEQALRIKPEIAEAHYNLGFIAAKSGRTEDAIKHWETAVRIRPNYAEVHYNLGILLQQAGRSREAIGHYQQALEISPRIAEANYNLGILLEQGGNVPDAIRYYKQALRIKPEFVEAQNSLARLLATLSPADGGDPIRAVELAQRVCDLTGSRTARYLDTLAVAYAATGRFDDAVATAQKAVDLARADGQTQLVTEVESRLALYRDRHAYRGSVGAAHPQNP